MNYRDRIAEIAPDQDPRQVEAFMRLERGTLDALTAEQFDAEARLAGECAAADPELAERLALSFGL